MTGMTYYGAGFPYIESEDMPGKLIVLEGNDGVGRSTQIQLLREYLEEHGFGVSDTGLKRSPLTQPGLDAAKEGHTLGPLTMSLFYATDFADRLENQIIPALKAGFIVLSDRYFFSTIARDIVRGASREWARKLYGFALVPDMIFYLKADTSTLVSRIINGRGFNYWESGMDVKKSGNLYDNFVEYQTSLTEQFDWMLQEYNMIKIDANRTIDEVFDALKGHIAPLFIQDADER
jgi:dTMP kinase